MRALDKLPPNLIGTPKPSKKLYQPTLADDDWDESIEDPVGECLTLLLNEGKIPHFGYDADAKILNERITGETNEKFSFPLLTMTNYRILKRIMEKSLHFQRVISGKTPYEDSIWFMIETFLVVYITIFSMSDVLLRYTMDSTAVLLFGILSTIVDVNDVQFTVLLMFQRIPNVLQKVILKLIYSTKHNFQQIQSSLLYGHRFQNRPVQSKEKERITKFRRKHMKMMKLQTQRRANRRARLKSRFERRKKQRKGGMLDEYDYARLESEKIEKQMLDEAVDELRRKPPTYFPNVLFTADANVSNMTKCHLTSLEYCHRMIFHNVVEKGEKQISISKTRVDLTGLSPQQLVKDTHAFPDIKVNTVDNDDASQSGTVNSLASVHSLSCKYYFELEDKSDFDSDEDSCSSGEDNDNIDFDEDELSQVSYASEEVVNKMDWIAVGAKIGTKILKSGQVHRVIANPYKKLLAEESTKLIGNTVPEATGENVAFPFNPSTFESKYSRISDDYAVVKVDTKTTYKSAESPAPKPPIHRMLTNVSSVTKSSSQYGADTLPSSSIASPIGSGIKIYASSTQENVELLRQSPERQYKGKCDIDTNTIEDSHSIGSPYDLWTVNSITSYGSYASTQTTPSQAFDEVSIPRNSSVTTTRLAPMEKGVKIVVPMFAPNVNMNNNELCFYQMGTVISSTRIVVASNKYISPSKKQHKWSTVTGQRERTNCLAIKVVLDKAILRGSHFAEMNIRIMDEWNWIPRFSKYPIGSCVATTYGIGVLVGWRVEDDMHIIRSLWNRSGPGSGLAYLRRECLHSVVEAAIGFDVETRIGSGVVQGYIRGGKENRNGKYFVHLKSEGRYQNKIVEFKRNQITCCRMAKFIPVTEHIRAAALYQLEILHYKARIREHMLNEPVASTCRKSGTWRKFSEYVDLFAASLSKATAEDPDFDREVDKFISHIITVLDENNNDSDELSDTSESVSNVTAETDQWSTVAEQSLDWKMGNIQDIFASFFIVEAHHSAKTELENEFVSSHVQKAKGAYDSLIVILRVLLKTIAVTKAAVPNRPKLHIALAMIHEGLLFVRQVIRVNKNNISEALIETWFRTLNEITRTFGPMKQRVKILGKKIAKKVKKHSNIAKKRVLSLVDIVLGDTLLLHALERGDWKQLLLRVEYALVKANITDDATCEQLHRGVILLYKSLAPRKKDGASQEAARRTQAKALGFAKIMKILASPGRSFLRFLAADDTLELLSRVLLRIFDSDPQCAMMINIYAFNFDSLRHLRTLNNMPISAKLWGTIFDAVEEELISILTEVPDQTKYFVEPLIKLFSLGVAKFHCIQSGDCNTDWLDFLLEEDAIKIIHELDMKVIECLNNFVTDVKQLFEVMPYIKTFDNDILDLIDELDFDLMFKEITTSMCDPETFTAYITERTAVLVERFLDYLPRMSIPIEKRELQDGWVLTCRGSDGGDLRLSDINAKRENLLCQVLGNDNVFQPTYSKTYDDESNDSPKNVSIDQSVQSHLADDDTDEDVCVLHEAREMILSAQHHGYWVPGFGGLREPHFYPGVPSQLDDLPLSDSLKTGIDLWQSSAISDLEFTQIIIREISTNIEFHTENDQPIGVDNTTSSSFKPFNPKIDATVLLLEMKNLTLHLDEFIFRVEKGENRTIFDPVFEGVGSLAVKNVCISLRVEVKKEFTTKNRHHAKPLFHLATFDISLEKLKLIFKDTGADFLLNIVLKGFRDQITQIVNVQLKEQIKKQVDMALEHVNGLFHANPDLLLTILGTTLDELDYVTDIL